MCGSMHLWRLNKRRKVLYVCVCVCVLGGGLLCAGFNCNTNTVMTTSVIVG